jgi:hypothetical protein
VPPAEEDRRTVGFGGFDAVVAVDLDAVEQHLVVAAEVGTGEVGGHLGNGTAQVDAHGHPRGDGHEPAVRQAAAGGVERADDGSGVHEQRRHRRAGRDRLVDVQHVELLVAQHADRAQCRRQVGGDRGHRPVRRRRDAVTQGGHKGGRRWTVARREDACLDALRPQHSGQSQDLQLHPTGDAEAVRAHETDTHYVVTLVPKGPIPDQGLRRDNELLTWSPGE